jgi:hypothetical protein
MHDLPGGTAEEGNSDQQISYRCRTKRDRARVVIPFGSNPPASFVIEPECAEASLTLCWRI